jgi:hypothetical protein
MAKLILAGWKPGLKKISLTQLIRSQCGLSLADAKLQTDRLLDGERVEIELDDDCDVQEFASQAKRLGVDRIEINTSQSELVANGK